MPDRRQRWKRWLGLALAIVLAGGFAYLNAEERVSLHLGLFVLYRMSLVGLLFAVFLLGMVTMFLIGLRQDLEVRRALRQYRVQEERRPWGPEPREEQRTWVREAAEEQEAPDSPPPEEPRTWDPPPPREDRTWEASSPPDDTRT